MRTSILSRSVIAVASLAIGSVALAAAPATAATPSGITREQVLTAADGVRAASPTPTTNLNYGAATNRAVRAMVNRACAVDPDGPEIYQGSAVTATTPGASADGVVVTAVLLNSDSASPGAAGGRYCSFGAVAPRAAQSVLSGIASLGGAPAVKLSGDVFVTASTSTPLSTTSGAPSFPVFYASGQAIQSKTVKVSDKKTTKEKKAAKATYAKRLKAYKKSYAKALDRAGSSKSKKAAAKKSWNAKKKSAKAKYRYGVAGYKLVTRKAGTPFTVSAQFVLPAQPDQP